MLPKDNQDASLTQWQIISFAILAVINLLIYFPSFFHIARSDQIVYLANTVNSTDWYSSAIGWYSYDRTYHFLKGFDPVLFRPMFFFILGSEKWLFGYNFVCWQVTGFILHLLVVWHLLKLLLNMRLGIFAVLSTLCFSVLFISMEMVIWHHISSYLLFLSCTLIALYQLYQITAQEQVHHRQLWTISLCLLISVFIYETGVVHSLLFFLAILFIDRRAGTRNKQQSQRAWVLLVLAPVVLYLVCNGLDLYAKKMNLSVGQYIAQEFDVMGTVKNTFLSALWWIYTGLFPGLLETSTYQRTIFSPGEFLSFSKFQNLSLGLKCQVISAIGLIGIYVLGFLKSLSGDVMKRKWLFSSIVLIMLLAQLALTVIGRIYADDFDTILKHNPYYGYIFWLYFLVLIYYWMGFEGSKIIQSIAAILIVILIGANSYQVYHLNTRRAKVDKPMYYLLKEVRTLVKEHGHEEDFSFGVDPKLAFNLPWAKRREEPDRVFSYLELLYLNDYKGEQAKYYYLLEGGTLRRAQR